MKTLATALLTLLILNAGPVSAQSLDDIAKAESALDTVWAKTPLTVRQAFFVTEPASGFGVYSKRPDAKFKQGEQLLAYAEPVGYGWKNNADGTYAFGFDIDLAIQSADGNQIMKKPNFAHLALTSHAKNHEFMVSLTLDLTGADPGDYIAAYTLRDIASDKSTVITLPFTIVQ